MDFNDDLDSIFDEDTSQVTEDVNLNTDMDLDDIFSDDDIVEKEGKSTNSSIMDKYLESKGFVDSKIKVIDEDDKEVEVSFNDLSEEEQLDILNSISVPNNDYSENEVAWINELKANNLTIESFLDLYRQQIIDELGQQETTASYDIDSYSDEELFLLDLKNRYDLEDEELQKELEKELEDKDKFSKKINKIREEYKDLEDKEKANQKAEFEKQQQQQYDNFVNEMVGIAGNTSEFHGLELEDSDKNETLQYLLELDATGTSKFYRELNNPEKLFEVAWYLKHGKDAFRVVSEAYEAEIARLKSEKDKPSVIVRR